MANKTIQKILSNLSANKNVQNLVSELQKLSAELKDQGSKLNTKLQSHAQYQTLMGLANQSQKELDRELKKALAKIKKSAADVEKNLKNYKKKATAQSKKLEKILKGKAVKASKKKTATRKKARKTTTKRS